MSGIPIPKLHFSFFFLSFFADSGSQLREFFQHSGLQTKMWWQGQWGVNSFCAVPDIFALGGGMCVNIVEFMDVHISGGHKSVLVLKASTCIRLFGEHDTGPSYRTICHGLDIGDFCSGPST